MPKFKEILLGVSLLSPVFSLQGAFLNGLAMSAYAAPGMAGAISFVVGNSSNPPNPGPGPGPGSTNPTGRQGSYKSDGGGADQSGSGLTAGQDFCASITKIARIAAGLPSGGGEPVNQMPSNFYTCHWLLAKLLGIGCKCTRC